MPAGQSVGIDLCNLEKIVAQRRANRDGDFCRIFVDDDARRAVKRRMGKKILGQGQNGRDQNQWSPEALSVRTRHGSWSR
jgi:hypothetical protein